MKFIITEFCLFIYNFFKSERFLGNVFFQLTINE